MTTFPNIKSSVKKYPLSQNAFLPRVVTVSMTQEANICCKPVVQIGNFVNEGQVIAVPPTQHGAKIHAPVPGKVIDIKSIFSAEGKPEVAVLIALSGNFSYTGKKEVFHDWKTMSPNLLRDKFADNGIINTFSVSNPLSLAEEIYNLSPLTHTIVVRMFDEDPVRLTDTFISYKYYKEIKQGADILLYASGLKNLVFVFDEAASKEALEMNPEDKYLFVDAKKYPSGGKVELCEAFNRQYKKNPELLTPDNVLFVDASTLYEIYKGIVLGVPAIDHLVQFSGNCIPSSCVLNVRLGSSIKDIVKQIGGFDIKPKMVVINGHLCGNSVSSLDTSISKYVKSVTFYSKNKTPEQLVYSCVSCGSCRSICPRNLAPDLLYRYKSEQYPLPENYIKTAEFCAECSLCNSVCPCRLPLSQIISLLKKTKEETK